MRYLTAFVCGLALVVSPLSVTAQDGEEAKVSEQAPEEPALQLRLDDAGVEVVPSPPRTFGGRTIEELKLRKRRAGLALVAPAVVTAAGIVLFVYGTSGDCYDAQADDWDYRDGCRRPRNAGMVLKISGGVGLIVGSVLYGERAKAFRQATKDYTLEEVKLGVDRARDYTLEEVKLGVNRARIGFYVSAGTFLVGMSMGIAAAANTTYVTVGPEDPDPDWVDPVGWTGVALMAGGVVGLIVTAPILSNRRRKLRELNEPHYGRPRRVQWDISRSALVF